MDEIKKNVDNKLQSYINEAEKNRKTVEKQIYDEVLKYDANNIGHRVIFFTLDYVVNNWTQRGLESHRSGKVFKKLVNNEVKKSNNKATRIKVADMFCSFHHQQDYIYKCKVTDRNKVCRGSNHKCYPSSGLLKQMVKDRMLEKKLDYNSILLKNNIIDKNDMSCVKKVANFKSIFKRNKHIEICNKRINDIGKLIKDNNRKITDPHKNNSNYVDPDFVKNKQVKEIELDEILISCCLAKCGPLAKTSSTAECNEKCVMNIGKNKLIDKQAKEKGLYVQKPAKDIKPAQKPAKDIKPAKKQLKSVKTKADIEIEKANAEIAKADAEYAKAMAKIKEAELAAEKKSEQSFIEYIISLFS